MFVHDDNNLLTASAFSFLLSPRGAIFEITTVLISVFKDVAIFTKCPVISSGVSSRVRLFVPTCSRRVTRGGWKVSHAVFQNLKKSVLVFEKMPKLGSYMG